MRLFRPSALAPTLFGLAALAMPALAAEVHFGTTDFPPYMSASQPGNGVMVAIATEAFKRSGYTLKVSFLPWARALEDGKKGDSDGVLGIWKSPEREPFFVFSSEVVSNQIGLYKRADSPIKYSSMADLKSYTIGTVRGYANPAAFDAAKLHTAEVTDDETNLRKLASSRIDLMLVDKGVAQHLIDAKAPELKGKLAWIDPPIDKLPLFVGISKKTPDYEKKLAALNQGLDAMKKDGSLAKMVSQAGI